VVSMGEREGAYRVLVVSMGEREGAYRVLVGEPEGRRPFGRPRRIWEVNIKKDLKK